MNVGRPQTPRRLLALLFLGPALTAARPPCVHLHGSPTSAEAIGEALALGPVLTSSAAECPVVQVSQPTPGEVTVALPGQDPTEPESAREAAQRIEAWLAGPVTVSAPPRSVVLGASLTSGLTGDGDGWLGAGLHLTGVLGPLRPGLRFRYVMSVDGLGQTPLAGSTDVAVGLALGWALDLAGLELRPEFGLGIGVHDVPDAPAWIAIVHDPHTLSARGELALAIAYWPIEGPGLELRVAATHFPDPRKFHGYLFELWPTDHLFVFHLNLGVNLGL